MDGYYKCREYIFNNLKVVWWRDSRQRSWNKSSRKQRLYGKFASLSSRVSAGQLAQVSSRIPALSYISEVSTSNRLRHYCSHNARLHSDFFAVLVALFNEIFVGLELQFHQIKSLKYFLIKQSGGENMGFAVITRDRHADEIPRPIVAFVSVLNGNVQPRSQGLSPFPPLSGGKEERPWKRGSVGECRRLPQRALLRHNGFRDARSEIVILPLTLVE